MLRYKLYITYTGQRMKKKQKALLFKDEAKHECSHLKTSSVVVSVVALQQKLYLITNTKTVAPLYCLNEAFLEKFTRITKCAE